MEFKQTWWDNNLSKRFDEFTSWIGSSDSTSKIFFRNYIKEKKYKTLIDLGCGTATEFSAYQKEYPELSYLGVDSSKFLFDLNTKLNIPMWNSSAENTNLISNHSEVIFSRHVLEHQPTFQPVLLEMIRLASKEAIHVFFIPPKDDPEHIGYDSSENLYHNRYNKNDIELFLTNHKKVKDFKWIDINTVEVAICIKIKEESAS
jgi:ubiquinone/menaquinone biosynthesis C-methylase UbiE